MRNPATAKLCRTMAPVRVRIEIIEQRGGKTAVMGEREIVTESHKRLTGNRAAQILHRCFPEARRALVTKSKDGSWSGMISLEPSERCAYHYAWRVYRIFEIPEQETDSAAQA